MSSPTKVSDIIEYVLEHLPAQLAPLGDVTVVEGPYPLEDHGPDMVVIADATLTQTAHALGGESGAMQRVEQAELDVIAYAYREGEDAVGDARRRAVEILAAVDTWLRANNKLGGLVMFAWLRPAALHKVIVSPGREAHAQAVIETQGIV